jgi:eukaryotic-like serine/threonine-protein kinase
MTGPANWPRVQEVFAGAIVLPPQERATYLATECGDDASLREQVQLLLDSHDRARSFLETPPYRAPQTVKLEGQRIGAYEVVSRLGAGGMGEVYRARDLKLGRDVAIKVLPPLFTQDPERLRRFEREARVLASLSHPNVGAIFGLEDANGLPALVLELIDGETLAERLARERTDSATATRGLPFDEAFSVAAQIAAALEAAHARGIIHRDLKPANIKIATNGTTKVLDFGLAKVAVEPRAPSGESATVADAGTRPWTVLGTPAYMSPEQARGQLVDKRTDIWAFGCVFYELLTGRAAFGGATTPDTIAAILGREPDWQALPSRTPESIRQLLHRCFEKDISRRLRDISEARSEIEDARAHLRLPAPSHRRPSTVVAGITLLAVAIGTGFAISRFRRGIPDTPLRATALTTFSGVERYPSLSPDGSQVAFAWNGPKQDNYDIYVQLVGTGVPLRLTTNENADFNPAWSPDGRSIAFLRAGTKSFPAKSSEVRVIAPLGGPERRLTEIRPREVLGTPTFLAWCPDSTCVIVTDATDKGQPDSLFVVALETGEKRQLTHPFPPAISDTDPAVSSSGRSLVFRRNVTAGLTGELYLMPLAPGVTAGGDARRLTEASLNAANPTWMPTGDEILFAAQDHLWRLSVPGDAPPTRLAFVGENGSMPMVSRAGSSTALRLVYVRSLTDENIWRVETSGTAAPALTPPVVAISSTSSDLNPQLSPDGRRVAFQSNRSGEFEIWLADLDGGNSVRLTSMAAPRTGTPRWSPDGSVIAFNANPEGHWETYLIPAAGGKPRRLMSDPTNDNIPSFSRDGRWIYFSSNRSGEFQIWRVPTTGGDAVQVTRNGGYVAFEGADGAVYYTQTSAAPSILWRLDSPGGVPFKVVEGVVWRNFAVLDRGIYYIDQPSSETRLQFFDFASQRPTTIARGLGDVRYGMTASADGRTILYSRVDSSIDDLMLVEHFR